MKVLDLFSGIGGFSLGLHRCGMQTVAFCEIDEFCRKVLSKNFPGIPIHEDIKELKGNQFRGAVELICGGFPCQDISSARGKGEGIEGAKSGLWRFYKDIIGDVRPKWVIVENSPMLTRRGLGTVLSDLASIGFDAVWHCIPACAVGAPHQRDRIWIIAYPTCKPEISNKRAEELQKEMAASITNAYSDRFKATHTLREWSFSTGGSFWQQAMPEVLGVGHGIPNWTHRIKALGNSVVPQVVEIIGNAIMEIENNGY